MISIITVTYNNFDDLHRTLNSLEKIDGIEKIVVNGGECTKTKEYLSDFDGIAISEPDKGISDAFNKGVSRAKGDNVMFLNSGDVLLSQDYLKEAENIMKSKPEISFIHSDTLFDDHISGIIYMEPLKSAFFKEAPLGRGMPYNHLTMVIRKNVFEKMQDNNRDPQHIVEKEGLIQQSDPKELEKIISEVLSKNQDKLTQYKSGKVKLFGYFVGEVMKVSKGKANPQLVNEILKTKLK